MTVTPKVRKGMPLNNAERAYLGFLSRPPVIPDHPSRQQTRRAEIQAAKSHAHSLWRTRRMNKERGAMDDWRDVRETMRGTHA
jgi:hypothetical protein